MDKTLAQKIIAKTRDDYNRIAPQFDSTRKYNWNDIAKVIKDLNIRKGSKVLDIGCGGGRLYELLKEYEIDYTGVDISSQLIKIAKNKYPEAKFEVNDIVNFNSKEKYDYVFSIAVLHHIPSERLRKRAVENIKKSLSQNGTAIISVWYFWNQWKYLKMIINQFITPRGTRLPLGDFYVPWKNQEGKIMAQRYHHAWTAHQIKKYGFKIVAKKRNIIGLFK